jgi:predicted glycosyltransferase
MDEPASLIEEWDRKGVFPQLRRLYDEIWVYGLPEIFDPLAEIPGFDRLESLVRFTGYLRREPLAAVPVDLGYALPTEPFLLVTTGGGGDGDELIDWVLSAYEADPGIPFAAVVLFGPFLELDHRAALSRRAARLPRIHTLTFESRVEALIERASGIVAMGGYNTFCEILSFGKPALVVPRTEPRLEQLLRAQRAERLGLLRMLEPPAVRDPMVMARALREFVGCAPPAPRLCDRMLCGLDTIAALAEPWLGARVPRARLSRVG